MVFLFVSHPMFLCDVCVFVCTVCGRLHLCGSRNIEAQDQLHTLIFRFCLPCFCQGLSQGSGFQQLDQVGRSMSLMTMSVSTSTALVLQVHTAMPSVTSLRTGFQLRASCLHGKQCKTELSSTYPAPIFYSSFLCAPYFCLTVTILKHFVWLTFHHY